MKMVIFVVYRDGQMNISFVRIQCAITIVYLATEIVQDLTRVHVKLDGQVPTVQHVYVYQAV